MEEAVTKKFVHEDSSHIIALCSEYTPHAHAHLLDSPAGDCALRLAEGHPLTSPRL